MIPYSKHNILKNAPSKICYLWGVDDAALVMGAASAASAGANAAISGKMNRKAVREQRRNREWATKERLAQQEWQEQQWDKAAQWNLEQWNRQNEYNSPAQQVQRMLAAGLNPLSLTGDAGNAGEMSMSSPSGVGEPGVPSAPQMFNPADQMNSQQFTQAIATFANLALEKKKADASIKQADAEAAHKNALTLTENLMRNHRVELLGCEIDLTKSHKDLNEQNVKESMQRILESQQSIQTSIAQMEYLGVQKNWTSFDMICKAYKLDAEKRHILAAAMNLEADTKGKKIQNRNMRYQGAMLRQEYKNYYEGKPEGSDKTYYQQDIDLRYRQMEGNTKAPIYYNIEHATEAVSGVAGVAGKAATNYKLMRGLWSLQGKGKKSPNSIGNPLGAKVNVNPYNTEQYY